MDFEFGWIGWYEDKEENSDKIWGFFYRPTPEYDEYMKKPSSNRWGWSIPDRNICYFWGRRGKAMQFKAGMASEALSKARGKSSKGYDSINKSKLMTIWPTFEEEAKVKLSFEVLVGNVK